MKEIYSVSAVNQYIRQMFESDYALSHIYVKGEVSNCKYHTSGHIYFTLKDRGAAMACVMFAGSRRGLSFRLSEGMQVIVLGSISVYERDGKYQLYAREIIQDGVGALYEQFESLKRKLESEGLFDAKHKKKLPAFAKKIGIVTAKTGAALHDMINVTTRRNPFVQLVFCPAKVQGDGAAETIVKGIKALDDYGVDVIIVGRGGGSIEDLWAFNEEIVARAIYACKTPIISAVGHETDFTIADYAADMRAPTPSAAAELACADVLGIIAGLDEMSARLDRAMRRIVSLKRQRLSALERNIQHLSPERKIREKRQQALMLEERLHGRMEQLVMQARHRLSLDIEKLHGLSPANRLKSGYAYISDENHQMIKRVHDVRAGDKIHVTMADGMMTALVTEKKENKEAGEVGGKDNDGKDKVAGDSI